MIEIYKRRYTSAEKEHSLPYLPSKMKRYEGYFIKFLFIVVPLSFCLAVIEDFFHVSSNNQLIISIAAIIFAVILTHIFFNPIKKEKAHREMAAKRNKTMVEVIHAKPIRAVKREDPEDIGSSYYLEVMNKGKLCTLYLQGVYLYDYDLDDQFPNTDFELLRDDVSKEFIDLIIHGKYFDPEKVLPAIEMKKWKALGRNGDLLLKPLEEVLAGEMQNVKP